MEKGARVGFLVVSFYYMRSSREPWLEQLMEQFSEKIKHFIPFQIIPIKTDTSSRAEKARKKLYEEKVLLAKMEKYDVTFLLDEHGKSFKNSIQFSSVVAPVLLSHKRVAIVVGGAYGVTDIVKSRATYKISLGALTLNHHIAIAVTLEQLYRALAIEGGCPYHNI